MIPAMSTRTHCWKNNLNNYFNFYVCLSFHPPPFVRKLTSVPPGISQNATNKGCLVRYESEKYAFWVPSRPLESIGHTGQLQGVKVLFLIGICSCICNSIDRIYQRSGYFQFNSKTMFQCVFISFPVLFPSSCMR